MYIFVDPADFLFDFLVIGHNFTVVMIFLRVDEVALRVLFVEDEALSFQSGDLYAQGSSCLLLLQLLLILLLQLKDLLQHLLPPTRIVFSRLARTFPPRLLFTHQTHYPQRTLCLVGPGVSCRFAVAFLSGTADDAAGVLVFMDE